MQGQLQGADGKALWHTNHREQGTAATRTPWGRSQRGDNSSRREVMLWRDSWEPHQLISPLVKILGVFRSKATDVHKGEKNFWEHSLFRVLWDETPLNPFGTKLPQPGDLGKAGKMLLSLLLYATSLGSHTPQGFCYFFHCHPELPQCCLCQFLVICGFSCFCERDKCLNLLVCHLAHISHYKISNTFV